MRIKWFSLVVLLFGMSVHAQYLNEIGGTIGGSNYSGDIGSETYIMPNALAGGFIYRRNLNNRITLRATYSYYPLIDADSQSSNEVRKLRDLRFNNYLNEATLGIELNFLNYDITNPNINFTPYLFFELAGLNYRKFDASKTINVTEYSYAIPLGLGFKSSLSREFGISLELRGRYAMTDDLEKNYPDIGNPRYNDWYFFTGIMITYSFQRPPCAVKPRY